MIKIENGIQVAVVGLGVSGLSTVRYLLAKGARVLVSESRAAEFVATTVVEELKGLGVEFEFDGHSTAFLSKAKMVVVSPGVPLGLSVFDELREADIPLVGELALAANEFQVPVIAVTGTNGKTTVTKLIDEIIRAAGRRCFAGGNIGTPLLESLGDGQEYDNIVLEVSSFQLDLAMDFAPEVGLFLNISPDHLDRHGGMDDYLLAKMKMFAAKTPGMFAILNDDDPICRDQYDNLNSCRLLTFGYGGTTTARVGSHEIFVGWGGCVEKYKLLGTALDNHIGLLNSAAAILACKSIGIEKHHIQEGLESFLLPRHRMELVRVLDGVDYYNDSKATNSGALLAALEQVAGKIILIAGGRGKGEKYSALATKIGAKVDFLVLMGEEAESIERAVGRYTKVERVEDMAQAVKTAKVVACSGDTVLLSPGCASFDMFTGYEERGDIFREQVNMLT